MNIHERIAKLARSRGLSLRKLSLLAGRSQNYLYTARNINADIHFSTFAALAKVLKVDYNQLGAHPSTIEEEGNR